MTSDLGHVLKITPTPLKTVVYRYHNPNWAWAPISGEGASIFGGRFNPKGLPALYASLAPDTALKEMIGNASSKLIDPCLLCSYQVNIARVIDLTQQKSLFETPWRLHLLQGDEPPGHRLAKQIKANNLADAILVPSYAAKQGTNLVCFQWNSMTMQLNDPEGRLKQLYRKLLE